MTNSRRSTDGPSAADRRFELKQAHATAILEESEYDTELGLRMARDAIQVANGDLDEAVFHDRHHDAVVAEFGVDDRPTTMEGPADE
ncbi:MAG: 4Fe-4S ferredoxin N-terminal domain-containing protein [Halobacteriota archaeon]